MEDNMEQDKGQIIKVIKLNPQHKNTGLTRHFVGERLINELISELKIMKYFDDPGYYLLYFDNEGNELTDTYHDDLSRALKQANREFNVKSEEWICVNEDY